MSIISISLTIILRSRNEPPARDRTRELLAAGKETRADVAALLNVDVKTLRRALSE